MLHRFLAFLIAALTALSVFAGPCAAEPVFPPGLRVGLDPPGDLKPSARFSGFEDPDHKVAIAILDLPGAAYSELERAASAKIAGFQIKHEDFSFRSGRGQLFSGSGQVKGTTLHKWILLATAADRNLTAMIEVEVPEQATKIYTDAAIRKALASVTFRDTPLQEQLGLLPFKFGDLAGFQVKQVMRGAVVLTDNLKEDLSKQPYVIVSIGTGAPESSDDRARLARDLLATAPLRDIKVQSADRMRINGAPGIELRAEAQAANGDAIMVAQWLRFTGNAYLRIVGVGRKANWDPLFTRLRALRDGIEFR